MGAPSRFSTHACKSGSPLTQPVSLSFACPIQGEDASPPTSPRAFQETETHLRSLTLTGPLRHIVPNPRQSLPRKHIWDRTCTSAHPDLAGRPLDAFQSFPNTLTSQQLTIPLRLEAIPFLHISNTFTSKRITAPLPAGSSIRFRISIPVDSRLWLSPSGSPIGP